MSAPIILDGKSGGILLICDHASDAVPPGIDLGIDAALLGKHIAIDIGAAPLTEALAADLGVPAIFATVSRLVIDLHRQPDHPSLMPTISDGHAIPGNVAADRTARIARFHAPYHRALAQLVRQYRPTLLASIHSFTPELEQGSAGRRPWEAGILYNRDTRAARLAVDLLRDAGVTTGDNEPYSGRILNATLNRHGEANGIASLAIEIRNDEIAHAAGVRKWAEILGPMLETLRNRLASKGPLAT
ncbi:MAG: N-formylglutamate amidohydrolase [Pseudomonadota bacterium]|uniref:N-formylglutamate amidohydrolase n=1 Tax=Sphingomonas sp. ERG5 TaxID=1381597 RepID=UPI00054C3956|nr:N-formylglutamate amidohydrolase [Sphingomonas sp. ERG5]